MAQRVVVVGGGITGLACLDRLVRLGIDAHLIEGQSRVGGVIRTRHEGSFLCEAGPNTVQGSDSFRRLGSNLGLAGELIEAPPGLPRYVYADDRLHVAPLGPLAFAKSRLLSPRAKIRAIMEWCIPRRKSKTEESVQEFFERRFGREILHRLVAPFVSGVYAGNPAELSIDAVFPSVVALERRYGSVMLGALRGRSSSEGGPATPTLVSFRDGLETLVAELGRQHSGKILTGVEASRIIPQADSFEIQTAAGSPVTADSVVLATPAGVAAQLIDHLSPEAALVLREIRYASLVVASVSIPKSAVRHDLRGFGSLVVRGEGVRTLGAIWASSLFAGRAPENVALLTVFLGGATDPEAVHLSDEQIAEIIRDDLAALIGVQGGIEMITIDRYQRAIPQYDLGHSERIERIQTAISGINGLYIAGNWVAGVAVGDCIRQGQAVADAVSKGRAVGSL